MKHKTLCCGNCGKKVGSGNVVSLISFSTSGSVLKIAVCKKCANNDSIVSKLTAEANKKLDKIDYIKSINIETDT